RQLVIRNVLGGIKSAFTNLRRGHIKHFEMRFKSKRNHSQYFFVDHRALHNDMHLWRNTLREPLRFKNKEKKWIQRLMKSNAKNDIPMKNMIINRERTGKYFIQIPYKESMDNNIPEKKVVSIDPGVITFHTFYSPDGECGNIGYGFAKSLEPANDLIDQTQSHIMTILKKKDKKKNEPPSVQKAKQMKKMRKDIRRLKKKLVRIRTHMKNRVKDLHQKTIKYYCDNYKYIILPDFDAVRIAKKLKRQGMRKEARKTMELSHRTFIRRLKTKVNMYENCKLFLVGEHYTSQTCGNCGVLNKKLGRDRRLTCFNCEYSTDRDMNAARNILINHAHSLNIIDI
ncbi:MAG TPA: transposase, partial [Aquella sp.]|nr:transposase [Aquella sp.]